MKLNKKIVAGVAGALILGGASAAYAAIPDSDDTEYHACIANTGPVRAVYAIDKEGGESCAAGYTEKTWSGATPTKPSMKIVKKSTLSGGSGGAFTIAGNCGLGQGYVATAVGYKITPASPQSIGDVDVTIYEESLNPDGSDPGAFFIRANSHAWPHPSGTTSGQVTVEARVTCVKNIVAE